MATYCIGDVQGCFLELQELLKLIEFNPNKDQLWFAGDLVSRGPQSLEVLRFVKQLPNKVVVLGNHDLHIIALHHKSVNFATETLQESLLAPDIDDLIDWLRRQHILYHDNKLNYLLVHAGIYPLWTLAQAKAYATEIEKILRSDNYVSFLAQMYGDQPNCWHNDLAGWDRLRFISNSFTRMRFCTLTGKIDLTYTGAIGSQPPAYLPWFQIPRKAIRPQILFGHWSALKGETNTPNIYALDTGCVWGGSLTAMRLEDKKLYHVPVTN